MRGPLPEDKLNEIATRLPSLDTQFRLSTAPRMGQQIHDFVNEHKLGIALVCLSDAGERFQDVRNSLHEAYACLAWYREYAPNNPPEFAAISACKYYVDYVTLLLYATAEDVSFFIVHFLDIDTKLKMYVQDAQVQRTLERKKISSNAGKVGLYLIRQLPTHEVTAVTSKLHKSFAWRTALEYRNTWVHSKPPIVAGLGVQYARKSTLVTLDDGTKRLYFGGGETPEYTIEELLQTVHTAADDLAHALSSLAEIVIIRREALGERFDFEKQRVSFKLSVGPPPHEV